MRSVATAVKNGGVTVRDRIKELRRVRASDLRPNPRNWRQHPASQRQALQAVLDEVGFADVILARETKRGLEIIDGHLRADMLPDTEVPVAVLDVTKREADLLLATLDPLAGMADTDGALLASLLGGLNFDGELAALLERIAKEEHLPLPPGLTDPDAVPDVPEEPVTKPGDLWLLGDHLLLCGDASKAEDVARLLDGAKVGAMITDPPYNVGFSYAGVYEGQDNKESTEYGRWLWGILGEIEHRLDPGSLCFVWQAMINLRCFHDWFPRDFRIFASVKGMVQFRPTPVQFSWDPVVFWQKEGTSLIEPKAGRRDYFVSNTATWLQQNGPEKGGHPCPRPLDVVAYIVDEFSPPGSIVIDPFVGSGTTIIACERQGRRAFAMEIEPRYVDVSVRRWEQYTGGKAERA